VLGDTVGPATQAGGPRRSSATERGTPAPSRLHAGLDGLGKLG